MIFSKRFVLADDDCPCRAEEKGQHSEITCFLEYGDCQWKNQFIWGNGKRHSLYIGKGTNLETVFKGKWRDKDKE